MGRNDVSRRKLTSGALQNVWIRVDLPAFWSPTRRNVRTSTPGLWPSAATTLLSVSSSTSSSYLSGCL